MLRTTGWRASGDSPIACRFRARRRTPRLPLGVSRTGLSARSCGHPARLSIDRTTPARLLPRNAVVQNLAIAARFLARMCEHGASSGCSLRASVRRTLPDEDEGPCGKPGSRADERLAAPGGSGSLPLRLE